MSALCFAQKLFFLLCEIFDADSKQSLQLQVVIVVDWRQSESANEVVNFFLMLGA